MLDLDGILSLIGKFCGRSGEDCKTLESDLVKEESREGAKRGTRIAIDYCFFFLFRTRIFTKVEVYTLATTLDYQKTTNTHYHELNECMLRCKDIPVFYVMC